MSTEKELQERSGNQCELCAAKENLGIYEVLPSQIFGSDIYICQTCKEQIESPETIDPNHWRCLNDSMWSEVEAVKVIAWRILDKLRAEGWPQDLLDMMYLEDSTLEWAKALGSNDQNDRQIKHIDSNGVELQTGDTVVLIKDLNVKGATFTAKRGTAVRNIVVDKENSEFIEGKVNGQQIVILTKYVKKS